MLLEIYSLFNLFQTIVGIRTNKSRCNFRGGFVFKRSDNKFALEKRFEEGLIWLVLEETHTLLNCSWFSSWLVRLSF